MGSAVRASPVQQQPMAARGAVAGRARGAPRRLRAARSAIRPRGVTESGMGRGVSGGVAWHSPAAVPQHGGTHQAEEKSVAMTSSGNSVTLRWICSRFSTSAMKAPTMKSTTLRCTKCCLHVVPSRTARPALGDGLRMAPALGTASPGRAACRARAAQEQLQAPLSSRGICPAALRRWRGRPAAQVTAAEPGCTAPSPLPPLTSAPKEGAGRYRARRPLPA